MDDSNSLLTSHQYLRTLFSFNDSETQSQIHIANLSFSALLGADPWGRAGPKQNINQPVLLSTRVSLRNPFTSASASDTVDSSTVHYGILSKEILKIVGNRRADSNKTFQSDWSLNDLVDWLVVYLTGVAFGASASAVSAAAHYEIEGGIPCLERDARYKPSLIGPKTLRELEFTIALAKGTLMADNIVLRKQVGFGSTGEVFWASTLRIEGMRIPTLVGVNRNERTARQIVMATVEIEPYVCKGKDCYPELEEIVFKVLNTTLSSHAKALTPSKTVEESSFETLESLAIHVANRVIDLFILQYAPSDSRSRQEDNLKKLDASKVPAQVRVRLVKPTAVTFADAPAIEIVKVCQPTSEIKASRKLPFPLDGKLEDWLNVQEGKK